jgi:hypothetical protein
MTLNIIGLIISIVALAIILIVDKKEHGDCFASWCTIFLSCWALCSFVSLMTYNEPTALDVYRGKTTLEITYRDSVAIDSVVVYKMK